LIPGHAIDFIIMATALTIDSHQRGDPPFGQFDVAAACAAIAKLASGPRYMSSTWYVTFEVHKRGALPRRRSPRETKTFETEAEAKSFAQAKFDEGLVIYAGTINPALPRRLIASGGIMQWLENEKDREFADPSTKVSET
jgi:hypothetical protein